MKNRIRVLVVCILTVYSSSVLARSKNEIPYNRVRLNGYIGLKIDQSIHKQIKKLSLSELIDPFKTRNEKKLWQTEFWGKWMLSAVEAYKYSNDQELLNSIRKAAEELMSTQSFDGYIGNYAPAYRLQGWDIWGQKYTLLGLLSYYQISKDNRALNSACRLADNLINQIQTTGTNISRTGKYRGMPSSSVLEPMVKIYTLTGNEKYLSFAKYIVDTWEKPDGTFLISAALKGVSVGDRFKTPKIWWSWDNGEKAYEMISCYDGLLDLYRVTGDSTYLKSVEYVAKDIIKTEINITGSGTSMECFYHGAVRQTEPAYHMQETCFTFSWMKLCQNLLQLTGNSLYADQIEKTAYNAMLAALKNDGSEFVKYTPLEGHREAGEHQCGMNINCCNANGPRGLLLMPQWSVMNTSDGVLINGFEALDSRIYLNKKDYADIWVHSDFPKSDSVQITLNTTVKTNLKLKLRIPAWSKKTIYRINNERVDTVTEAGYVSIDRIWKRSDILKIKLSLLPAIEKKNGYQALVRGPIVLVRNSEFDDGFVDESIVFQPDKLLPQMLPDQPNHWMQLTVHGICGTNLEGNGGKPKEIHFCDFATSGNDWNPKNRYKVWLKETMNIMNNTYVAY